MVRNLGPARLSRHGACGDGRKTLVPSAGVAGVEGHGAGARREGCEGRLQEFAAIHLDGRNLSTQPGQDGDRAGAGPDENVFFCKAN